MSDTAEDDARRERRRRARRRVPERRPREADRPAAVRVRARRELGGWRHPQRWLATAATVLLVGLGLVGLGPSALGTALSLLGAVTMLYAIHRFGRLGPEPGR
jgi:hypothetical protein